MNLEDEILHGVEIHGLSLETNDDTYIQTD